MNSGRLLSLWVVLLFAACASTDGLSTEHPPLDEPLRVLLLGDSISMGYTPFVQEALAGRAEVQRAQLDDGRAENCQGTTHGLTRLDAWLAQDGGGWDVVHVNFGLHDLKRVRPGTLNNSNDPSHPHQAPPELYAEQLEQILRRIQASGARIVFATTTPVPGGELRPHRAPSDAPTYNRAALDVIADLGGEPIAINDLFAFITASDPPLSRPGDVHFSKDGSRLLGEQVAAAVLEVAGLAH